MKSTRLALSLVAGAAVLAMLSVCESASAAFKTDSISVGGADNTCAIRSSGQALCWGYNYGGWLGDGTTTDRRVPTPVSGLNDASSISAGQGHTCAIRVSGSVLCWGRNAFGQLGDGTTTDSVTPTRVLGLSDAKSISAGGGHTCAIRKSGQAVCWGFNSDGQLGNGSTADLAVPWPVQGLSDARSINAGNSATCAIRTSGQALCWGWNNDGQLGDGTTDDRHTPNPVAGLTDAKSIDMGSSYHTCATRNSGQALCWGRNVSGQLGDGTTEDRFLPTPVPGLNDAASISVGASLSCALRASGQALCWGWNKYGQVGDGTTTDRRAPTPVRGLTDAGYVISGDSAHACAMRRSGQAVCWGSNASGQLGDGTTTDRLVSTPVVDSPEKPKPNLPVQVVEFARGVGVVTIDCRPDPKKCRGSIAIKRGNTALIHKRSYAVSAGKLGTVRVRLTKAGKKALARSKRVRATMTVIGKYKLTLPAILKHR